MAGTRKPIIGQITNRNFLAPTGFEFTVNRAPKISYFGNAVNIPGMTLGIAEQPTYLKDIPLPVVKLEFEDLTLRFLVDEGLENYLELQEWLRGLGFPESLSEIYYFQMNKGDLSSRTDSTIDQLNLYSDGTLTVLDNLLNPKFKVKFTNLFPYRLTTLEFDATQQDLEYFTAQVSFKYTIYDIEKVIPGHCD